MKTHSCHIFSSYRLCAGDFVNLLYFRVLLKIVIQLFNYCGLNLSNLKLPLTKNPIHPIDPRCMCPLFVFEYFATGHHETNFKYESIVTTEGNIDDSQEQTDLSSTVPNVVTI